MGSILGYISREEKIEEESYLCPVGRFFTDLERKVRGRKSKFREHLTRSRIEFLKAIRSLVDERIEELEKGPSEKGGNRETKIEVE